MTQVPFDVIPDDNMYLREEWITGEYGDEKFSISPCIGGAALIARLGRRQARIQIPIEDILNCLREQPAPIDHGGNKERSEP